MIVLVFSANILKNPYNRDDLPKSCHYYGDLLRASELLRSVSGALKLPVEKAPEDDCVTGFGDVVDAEDVCSALEGSEVGDLCAWKGFGRRDAERLPDHGLPGDAYEKLFAKNRQLR